MSMNDGFKWEGGERVRPLNKAEVREAVEEFLAQWIDAHPGHDSGTESAESTLLDIGQDLEEALDCLIECSKLDKETT